MTELEKSNITKELSHTNWFYAYAILNNPNNNPQDIEYLKMYYQKHYYEERVLEFLCNYEICLNAKSDDELLKLIEDGIVSC